MSTSFFTLHLARVPVIAILRGLDVGTTVRLAAECWDAGITLVEVPAQDANGLRALEAAAVRARDTGNLIGAGTIYSVSDASRAADAGANFLVAPGINADTVQYAAGRDIPYLPGVMTPSEVQVAAALGFQVAKLFPAGLLGPDWLTALHSPFPDMNFVAVGGISTSNARAFLAAGALGVGVGGALSVPGAVHALANLRDPSLA